VSPLWPETIYAGLFPGHCRLQRGRKSALQTFPTPTTENAAVLLPTLEKMLDEQTRPVRKGSRLILTVSDDIAAVALMPWQEALRQAAEIDSYATICFEKLGMTIDNDWVMRAEFRQYGGMGLAYALPRAWLEALIAVVQARGLRLTAVLPLSAAAYYRARFKNRAGSTLLLLEEANRIGAMIYSKAGLLGHDVEPYTRSLNDTRLRLLRRIGSGYTDIAGVACWSTDAAQLTPPSEMISACFPEVQAVQLKHDAWN